MIRKSVFILIVAVFASGGAVWLWPETAVMPKSEENESAPPAVLPAEEKERLSPSEETVLRPPVEAVPKLVPIVSTPALDVPFTAQAPFAEWSDPLFQGACEEASLVMADHWITGKPLPKEAAKKEIAALSRFEEEQRGHAVDTSAADTEKLWRDYYGRTSSEVRHDVTLADMRAVLLDGALAIVPADGRKLKNPNFTQPGPINHMLVVIGYDAEKKEFIANDPGTKNGKGYRYDENILFAAIRDYPTGQHLPIKADRKAMIVIRNP